MDNRDQILVKDIPKDVIDSALQSISFYTVTFLTEGQPPDAELAGSGVLVRAADRYAILTADHVAERLPTDRIPIFLERTAQAHSIDRTGVRVQKIARGDDNARGPDLAAIILLAPSIAASLGAKKSFFPLDNYRDRMLNNPGDVRDGAWFIQGFLQERTVIKADPEGGYTKYFYNFTGVGGPDGSEEVDGFDIFEYPVDHAKRSEAPKNFGGMSGGGIWQVLIRRNKSDRTVTHDRPILSGILFYQVPTTETQCGVRAHGRRSVYEKAYNAIVSP